MVSISVLGLLLICCAHAYTAHPSSSILRGVNDYQAGSSYFRFPATDASLLNFTCEFTVPAKPPTWDGQTQVYLWCGINWYDSAGSCLGVMQPVLTYGCSPDAFSGVGCGTSVSDPHYANDPYWYFSSQYVVGWGPGQATGSKQMVKTRVGSKIYSEMSYSPAKDSWLIYGRDETTGASSTFQVDHPLLDASRSWRSVHADPKSSAALYAVSEPHQVSNPVTQMPNIRDFQIAVTGVTAGLTWQADQGSARVEQHGGLLCHDDPSITPGECSKFAAGGSCSTDHTWCKICAKSCGERGASCGCMPRNPPVTRNTIVGMDLMWMGESMLPENSKQMLV